MSTELALMDTDRWRCWGNTDHQGTLIITDHMTELTCSALSVDQWDTVHRR
ncbi:unnamed protein product, partial [Staurois parvus]